MKNRHIDRGSACMVWFVVCLLWISGAGAANFAGSNSVSGLIVQDGGHIILLADSRWHDVEGCNGWFDTIGMVAIPRSHPGYSGLFALALSARAAPGERLEVYTEGCLTDSLYDFPIPRVSSATF